VPSRPASYSQFGSSKPRNASKSSSSKAVATRLRVSEALETAMLRCLAGKLAPVVEIGVPFDSAPLE